MKADTFCKRSIEIAEWIVPGTVLALLPKCPACLAAYIGLATGLGVSFSTACYLRTSLIIVSVCALAFLASRCMVQWSKKRKNTSDLGHPTEVETCPCATGSK